MITREKVLKWAKELKIDCDQFVEFPDGESTLHVFAEDLIPMLEKAANEARFLQVRESERDAQQVGMS
jgi:hypothetical protein